MDNIERVADLEGMDLDYLVAIAEGLKIVTIVERWGHVILRDDGLTQEYSPTQSWMQGGPIIQRAAISLLHHPVDAPGDPGLWAAAGRYDSLVYMHAEPLVAAMRAYVALKFGEVVDWDDPALS